MRDGLDLRRLTNWLVGLKATLGVDQVRCKDGVDQSRLAQSSLACVQEQGTSARTPSEQRELPPPPQPAQPSTPRPVPPTSQLPFTLSRRVALVQPRARLHNLISKRSSLRCPSLLPTTRSLRAAVQTRTDSNDVELEATLEQLVLNLPRDGVESNAAFATTSVRLLLVSVRNAGARTD